MRGLRYIYNKAAQFLNEPNGNILAGLMILAGAFVLASKIPRSFGSDDMGKLGIEACIMGGLALLTKIGLSGYDCLTQAAPELKPKRPEGPKPPKYL